MDGFPHVSPIQLAQGLRATPRRHGPGRGAQRPGRDATGGAAHGALDLHLGRGAAGGAGAEVAPERSGGGAVD